MLWLYTADNELKSLVQENESIDEALLGSIDIYVEFKPFYNNNNDNNNNGIKTSGEIKKYIQYINNNKKKQEGEEDRNGNKNNTYPIGVTGLDNLGNTCFMNSALQCLSNTDKLTKYFINDKYINEINPKNPLGMEGKIASYYAMLIKRIWNNNKQHMSVNPSDFKWILGKFAPQFTGYRQHDAQELLSFLLDGLHEDLNRVIEKPYVNQISIVDKTDKEGANCCWQLHLDRNKSIIVDLFQGQLKSTLNCPSCNNISITFDPYMYLSLPIPLASATRIIQVTFIRLDGKPGTIYSLRLNSNGSTMLNLKTMLCTMININQRQVVIMECTNNILGNAFDDKKPINEITSDKLMAYEYKFDIGKVMVKVQHKKDTNTYFGIPLMLCVTANITADKLYQQIASQMQRFIKQDKVKSKYPFTLHYGPNHVGSCSSCLSMFCEGCIIKCDSTKLLLKLSTSLYTNWSKNYEAYDEEQEKEKNIHESCKSENLKGETVTLHDCFLSFLEKEQLGTQDTWFCPNCKEFQRAWKKFDIWNVPEYLVIHFKRFHFDKNHREKIETLVDYPINDLTMTHYLMKDSPSKQYPKYQLYGVAIHQGGLGSGHYTAQCKNSIDNQWYYFNDSVCTKIDNIKSVKGAYVLFYKRSDNM